MLYKMHERQTHSSSKKETPSRIRELIQSNSKTLRENPNVGFFSGTISAGIMDHRGGLMLQDALSPSPGKRSLKHIEYAKKERDNIEEFIISGLGLALETYYLAKHLGVELTDDTVRDLVGCTKRYFRSQKFQEDFEVIISQGREISTEHLMVSAVMNSLEHSQNS